MLIHNSDELKAVLLPKIRQSVFQTQKEVRDVVHKFLLQFYHEYRPEVYYRTQQLLNSLVQSEIIETPNGYRAEVYFDLTAMDYTLKKMRTTPNSPSGRIVKNDWDGEKEMNFGGVRGLHYLRNGVQVRGTAFWTESKNEMNAKLYSMLVANLKANGIPIR